MTEDPKGNLFTSIVLEVFKLSGLLTLEGDQLTREFGLTSARWKVLGALNLTDRPMTVPENAHVMGQTRQGVQRLVNEMTDDGLLDFQENPLHKRAKLIVLTKNGSEVYEKISQKQFPWACDIAAGLESSDLEKASFVLRALREELEA